MSLGQSKLVLWNSLILLDFSANILQDHIYIELEALSRLELVCVFVTPGSPRGGQGPLGPADVRPAARLPPQSPGPPGIPQSVTGVI